jgi:23S rRNA (cytosine1962-C5)-methyltransferase
MAPPLSAEPSGDDPGPRPVLRLRPKADTRRLRFGHPWVYSDEAVLDRRSRALAPGTLARLEDSERRPLGLVAVTPESRIVARVLDGDPEARLDREWFEARLGRALALREVLFDAPYYRLVHAEADGLPGVVVDRFGDSAVLQPNAAWAEAHREALADALAATAGIGTVVMNGTGRTRALEGLPEERITLRGAPPAAAIDVPMNGAIYKADLLGGQKTGLFFDQRPNQAFAARLARGAEVLDVFSHVGGFALAALAAGASRALAVDSSAPALALAEAGASASGVAGRFETMRADAFAALESLGEAGRRFGLVVCDPPAFAPSKPALEKGLRAYERVARLAAPLVAPGGFLVLCSCSHAADLPRFRAACLRGIGRAGRAGAILYQGGAAPDHPMHPHLAESGYLKALAFRL